MSQGAPALSRTALSIRTSVFAELAPRIEAHTRRGGDLIALHIGDTHLPPPVEARFSRSVAADDGPHLYRYGSISGLSPLREAFAGHLLARGFGPPSIDPLRQVLVACGATHALFCGARAVLNPGDEVLVATPYWPLSVGVLLAAGATPVEVPLTARLHAQPDADPAAMLEAACTPRTRAVYLITPNNPDGKVLSRHHLASIARLAVRRGLWVMADEVYADFVYEGEHTSIARDEGMAERTLSAYSLSKSHGLPGARVGFLVGPEAAIDVARRIATHTVFNVPVAAQQVALAALASPATWLDGARDAYRAARDQTMAALVAAGVRAAKPDGGSYVFLDCAPILEGRPLRLLLEHAIDRGVLLAPGDAFGDGLSTWARLCFTSVPPARLREGLARLARAIADLRRAPP